MCGNCPSKLLPRGFNSSTRQSRVIIQSSEVDSVLVDVQKKTADDKDEKQLICISQDPRDVTVEARVVQQSNHPEESSPCSFRTLFSLCSCKFLRNILINSFTDDLPKLHQLQRLEHREDTVNVMETVAPIWEKVAVALHFEGYVAVIKQNNQQQVEPSCLSMFSEWLNGRGRRPASWLTLVDVLREVNLSHVADRITTILAPSVPGLIKGCVQNTPAEVYRAYLQSVYLQVKEIKYDKWPGCVSVKYINLAMIDKDASTTTKEHYTNFAKTTIRGHLDDILLEKHPIMIEQVALDGIPKCILVEGAPGVGKTTFSKKLCKKWAKGKLLHVYQFVVLIKLRDTRVREVQCIRELFRYPKDQQTQQNVTEEIIKNEGKGLLFVLDGFDELPKEQWPFFMSIIKREELPQATILVTSRPWATTDILIHHFRSSLTFQRLEIIGFTRENIMTFLESNTAGNPALLRDIHQYLEYYPHMIGMMHIPLNCAIVLEVYGNCRHENRIVPKTMTDLYSSLIRTLLLRYLHAHPVHGTNLKIREFSDLPEDIFEQFLIICHIAFKGIAEKQMIFQLPNNFDTLGLMESCPELYPDEGMVVSHNFLHLTIQEFLAAYILSREPNSDLVLVVFDLETYSYPCIYFDSNHFKMVRRFFSGLTKLHGSPTEVHSCITEDFEYPHDTLADIEHSLFKAIGTEVCLGDLQWLFEAQNIELLINVLGHKELDVSMGIENSPFDWFALGYVLSHSNAKWKTDISDVYCCSGDNALSAFICGITEELCSHCRGGLSGLRINDKTISKERLHSMSLKLPLSILQPMREFYIEKIAPDCYSILPQLMEKMPQLKLLSIKSGLSLNMNCITESLQQLSCLESLELIDVKLDHRDCCVLNTLLSSPLCILRDLNVSNNELHPPSLAVLIEALNNNATLEDISLEGNMLSLENIELLGQVLCNHPTLVKVNISNSEIDAQGATVVARSLSSDSCRLTTLKIARNPRIGEKGAIELAKMLANNSVLSYLHCSNINLGYVGAEAMAEAICKNSTLKRLTVADESMGEDGALLLASVVETNRLQVHLYLLHAYQDSVSTQFKDLVCTNIVPKESERIFFTDITNEYHKWTINVPNIFKSNV